MTTITANTNINNLNSNINNNAFAMANPNNYYTANSLILNHNLLDETKFFETFSTYKIFTLELISIFCNIRKIKLKKEKAMETGKTNESNMFDTSSSSFLNDDNQITRDGEFNAAHALKIMNVILKSIKTADLDAEALIQMLADASPSDHQIFLKFLNDRINKLAKNTIIELRNLIVDLKIYIIGVNDSLIKPWSVVGKYVRRCIIIYEKMPFEKLVVLTKQVAIQFKHLSKLISNNIQRGRNSIPYIHDDKSITQKLAPSEVDTSINNKTYSNQPQASNSVEHQQMQENAYEIDNSNSPTTAGLFLNDESNLTITGEFNRTAHVDYSAMDLEPLDESLTQTNTNFNANSNNNNDNNNIHKQRFNIKALTSTVSAQRTQSQINILKSNIKTNLKGLSSDLTGETASNQPTTSAKANHQVKFSLKSTEVRDDEQQAEGITIKDSPIEMAQNKSYSSFECSILSNKDAPIGKSNIDNKNNEEAAMSLVPQGLSIKNSCAFSRKIAEYFVAQQAHLIENNEHEAMSPSELQDKIDELISYDSSFSDAYYLKFLNHMRLRDYPSSLKALHDYFDRLFLAGSVSLAALNLCSLEYRFDNKENALFALKEAITSAHQEGDIACLQHCLSWLYKMDSVSNIGSSSRKNFLIKSACSRAISNELFALASYNLHYFARTNVGKHQPQSILNLLNKTDMVNLKMNSSMEINLLSQCHKASLWNLYGQKKICTLFSQMLLNLLPKSSLYRLNTESQCIAMCYVALDFSRNGYLATSQKILDHCKEIYSPNSKISEHWLYTENLISIEKHMLSGKWGSCKVYIKRMASINIQQAMLQEMNIFILEGNQYKAKEIGNKILSNMNSGFNESTKISSYTNNMDYDVMNNNNINGNNNSNTQFEHWNEQMNISLKFNFIQIYIALREYPNALILAIKFYNEIKQLDFNYEFMLCCLSIAKILIHMEHADQALKYLEKCNIYLYSNGSVLDQAKLHYLYAKCLHILNKEKNLATSIAHMYKCVEKLEMIEASIYLISAYSYLSLLLNESNETAERNKYAFKYRQLRKQLPLIGFLL